ncbi:MAG: hypothetical protein Q4F72_07790, partial [Desulfovibrionaceae bacterium]|nr:hypothetical protein [Desulfovibrionaceae bacterium]
MGKKTGKTRKKAAGGKSAKRSSGRILYFDGPAPEDGAVEAWIEAHCGSGIESMAGAAWEDLASPARREGALAALWGLADEGSALAACALGCLVRQGLPAPEGTDAKALLEKAAEAGIGPAYLELAQMELARTDGRPDGTRREEAAPEEGQPEKAPAEGARAEDSAASSCAGAAADLVLKGFELGSPGCALLLAEQRLAGQILLSEETAEELGTALLACAGAGSWPSLKALADLLAETSPCA